MCLTGQSAPVQRLSLQALVPNTEHYMTYEGSTTMPACHETVTWIVINKPIYITKQQLYALRKLMQGDEEYPKAPLGSNFRPPQSLHHRVVRTNIDFNKVSSQDDSFKMCICSIWVHKVEKSKKLNIFICFSGKRLFNQYA